MAQQEFRLDLLDVSLPLLSTQQGSVVISSRPEEFSQPKNRPGVLYYENIMPTEYGLVSAGYRSIIGANAAIGNSLDCREVLSTTKQKCYIGFTNALKVFVKSSSVWLQVNTPFLVLGAPIDLDTITTGTVAGVTYIYIRGKGIYTYDSVSRSLQAVTAGGLDLSAIICIASSNGYLLAFSETAVAWSSTTNPLDFVPSSATGAGGGGITGLAGRVKFAVPNVLGLIIYSESNAVAAIYTGNAQYPFKLSTVPDSKGGISLSLAAYEANSVEQFVYTEAGLQAVTVQKAVNILPEVTEFLAGGIIERYDPATSAFIQTAVTSSLRKQVKFILARYLVISYGSGTVFDSAILYDTALKRYGKLNIAHTDVFEYAEASAEQPDTARTAIAFVSTNGATYLLSFSADDVSSSLLILGKLQAARGKVLTLQEITLLSRVQETIAPSVRAIGLAHNGTKLTKAAVNTSNYDSGISYNVLLAGKFVLLELTGYINVSSAEIGYIADGFR